MTDQIKEAIGLLEKANNMLIAGDPVGYSQQTLYEWIDQALTKLREAPEPKCKTCMCMDCGKLIKVAEQSKHLKECPKRPPHPKVPEPSKEIEQLKAPEQPPAGEYTKRIRQWVEDHHYLDTQHSLPDFVFLGNKLLEACKIIDTETKRAEEYQIAIIQKAKEFSQFEARFKAKLDTSEAENKRLKKAIAKAKQGGE